MYAEAIAWISDYRLQRGAALNNEKRMEWSTVRGKSLDDFVDIFSSTDENAEWQKTYDPKKLTNAEIVKAMGLKIAFLAGCRRDIRIMYAAGETNRPRTALDWERFEYMRLIFHRMKIQALDAVIRAKSKGSEVIDK